MDRIAAARRVEKLRAVTEARGASPNEARVAAEKIRELERRFDLRSKPPPLRFEARRQARTAPPRVWAVPVDDVPWEFNVQTGEASANVKVKHYQNAANWSIEIPF